MTAPLLDGTLQRWDDVATAHPWQGLLLGNGMSINVWGGFAYRRLFDAAKDGGLAPRDVPLFARTSNFEDVLSELLTAIKVMEALGLDAEPVFERYRSVQGALGHAVREVHLRQGQVPNATLRTIRSVMEGFEYVFTTSYDLLVYWATARPRWQPFVDLFMSRGRCEFDPDNVEIADGQIGLYFLHGALHLVTTGRGGATWKLRGRLAASLLEQFGTPIPGEPRARPLLVTEGSAQDKLRTIEANPYLSHALDRLRACDLPMVVFGSSLAAQDAHLADALNEHPERALAISMRQDGRRALAQRQADLYGRLATDRLVFFDAATHPLGTAGMAAPES